MKSTEQHLGQLRRRTYQRQAESAQMRANLRKMRAARLERRAESFDSAESVRGSDKAAVALREEAEELRVEADNILEDWKSHQEDKYFEKLDPYADQREHTELTFVPTDQENSKLIVMIDLDTDTHIRSQSQM